MNIQLGSGQKLACDFSVSEGVGTVILWVIISILTLGLGLFVAPYYILKAPINRTKLIAADGSVIGQLHVDVVLTEIIGHAVIWVLLSIITLGLALIVYQFAVMKRLLNGVVIR
ncbi:MAG: hypothetical protein FD162_606 [Rhodobacteraceae bacterium]|uniref:DUF6693 family protein n=1 Tax=Cypionkella sp. TaxID=2811411 RepID=UPI0013249471|nr:DUF6693 family protein [Cypionkella sp.]KAF0175303.1 MAG: hypothetical protein FD162_606 [Paracoccaceae bacterium]MDO8325794.1 hypothetical protein [Cypionkella sp.]